MHFRYLLCATLLAFPTAAFAQAAPTYGSGMAVCSNLEQADFDSSTRVGQWILGYVSGGAAINIGLAAMAGDKSVADKIWKNGENNRISDLLARAWQHCQAHPNDKVYQSALSALKNLTQ